MAASVSGASCVQHRRCEWWLLVVATHSSRDGRLVRAEREHAASPTTSLLGSPAPWSPLTRSLSPRQCIAADQVIAGRTWGRRRTAPAPAAAGGWSCRAGPAAVEPGWFCWDPCWHHLRAPAHTQWLTVSSWLAWQFDCVDCGW